MSDLTLFLAARIAEDEEVARWRLRPGWRWGKHRAAYLLVQRSADRHAIVLHSDTNDPSSCRRSRLVVSEPCDVLKVLAARYAKHPDYRDTWRVRA